MSETVQRLRFISTISSAITAGDIYKLIRSRLKNYAIPYKIYLSILRVYFKEVSKIIVEEGKAYLMPSNLGHIAVNKVKTGMDIDENDVVTKKTFYVNWKLTRELKNTKVYLMNIDYILKIKWTKGFVKSRNLFFFDASKYIKSKVWHIANTNSMLLIQKYRDGK